MRTGCRFLMEKLLSFPKGVSDVKSVEKNTLEMKRKFNVDKKFGKFRRH